VKACTACFQTNNNYTSTNAHEGGNQGTEFWPPFCGYRIKVTESLLVLFTFVLAIFTPLLWRSTDKLWTAAQTQSNDMKDSIAVAKESANAAQKSADVSEQALIATQRAFIVIKEISVALYREADQPEGQFAGWKIQPILQNTGKTPAHDTIVYTNVEARNSELPDEFAFPNKGDDEEIATVTGPQSTANAGHFQLSIAQVREITQRTFHVYLYGSAEYNDVFEGTPRHRTEYCHRVTVVSDPARPHPKCLDFPTHKKHNRAT
jgi:hypothetical protein